MNSGFSSFCNIYVILLWTLCKLYATILLTDGFPEKPSSFLFFPDWLCAKTADWDYSRCRFLEKKASPVKFRPPEGRFHSLSRDLTGTFHFLSVPKETFAAFPQNSRYPKTMYFRLLAHKLLPDTVERVLYLDPDIVVIRPLEQLYQLPFDAHTLCYAATHVKGALEELNCMRLGVPDGTPYINTGVLLLDLKALRTKDRTEEMLRFIEEKQAVFTLPDQDIFTALYGQQTKLLDTMVYNLSDRILTIYNANLKNPRRGLHWVRENAVILHYCGRNKPWKKPYLGVLNIFYDELLQSLPASVQKTLLP